MGRSSFRFGYFFFYFFGSFISLGIYARYVRTFNVQFWIWLLAHSFPRSSVRSSGFPGASRARLFGQTCDKCRRQSEADVARGQWLRFRSGGHCSSSVLKCHCTRLLMLDVGCWTLDGEVDAEFLIKSTWSFYSGSTSSVIVSPFSIQRSAIVLQF